MLSPTSSTSSLDIESGAAQSTTTSRKSISRRTLLITAAVLAAIVLVVVVTTVAVTLRRASFASPSSYPTPTRTLGRSNDLPGWQLDTSRGGGKAHQQASATAVGTALVASRADASEPHQFQWSFPARNQEWLDAELEAVSDPQSSRYGQHVTFEALMAQVGPSSDEKAAVVAWLTDNGVDASAIADHGDILHVATTVGQVESLFDTTLHYHTHPATGQKGTVAAGDVRVPADLSVNQLHGVYNYPHPLMHIGTYRAQGLPTAKVMQAPITTDDDAAVDSTESGAHDFHTMQEVNSHCSGNIGFYALISPQFLAAAYNFPIRNTSTTATATSAIVTAFGTQAFSQADLTHQQGNIGFTQSFNPAVYNAAGNSAQLAANGPGDEADLDIQALYQVSPTSNNSFFGTSTDGQSQSLLQTLTAIAALPAATRPQVVSISYGFGASDYNYYHSTDGANTESKLQQLGTLGVTVVVSAGDDGANSGYNRQCSTSPNSLGYGTISPISTTTFLPQYPAASAYVLSVGETDFLKSAQNQGQAVNAFSFGVNYPAECDNCPSDQGAGFLCQGTNLGEEVVSLANKNNLTAQTSGGGLSSVFAVPSWQKANVSSYFSTKCAQSSGCVLPPSSYYSTGKRGYPDISAFGGQFGITVNGQESVVGGTSVSAPIVAGLIARLNEVQLARKGTTLGFVNPLFYNMATAQPNTFNDLTVGENTCPQGNQACQNYVQWGGGSTTCKGWRGAQGWDPVTGLGSPNIGNIISYLNTH